MSQLPPPPPPVLQPAAPAASTHRAIAERLVDGHSTVGQVAVSPRRTARARSWWPPRTWRRTPRPRSCGSTTPLQRPDPTTPTPTWSPDGRFLAFTSRRGETKGDSTLHLLPIGAPGELRTLCTMSDGLGDVAWSPDGRRLAFTSRTRRRALRRGERRLAAAPQGRAALQPAQRQDWVFDRPKHVYVIASDGTGTPRNLTPGEFQHSGVSWLRDSTGIVTSAQRHDTWDRDRARDLYVVVAARARRHRRHRRRSERAGAHRSRRPVRRAIGVARRDTRRVHRLGRSGHLPAEREGRDPADRRCSSPSHRHPLDLRRTRPTFQPTVGSPAPVWESDTHLLATAEDRGATHLYRMPADGVVRSGAAH